MLFRVIKLPLTLKIFCVMDAKKNPVLDIDNYRNLGYLFGLCCALGLTYWMFTFSKPAPTQQTFQTGTYIPDEIETELDNTVAPPPPESVAPPPAEVAVADFNEVETDPELDITLPDMDDFDSPVLESDYTGDGDGTGIPELEERQVEEQEVFTLVEKMPEFPGGEAALLKYLNENTRYPELPREMGIEERIVVKFVIEPDGSVSNVEAIRGRDKFLRAEAERVVKAMPEWAPGEQRGRPVRVSYNVPIRFSLRRD